MNFDLDEMREAGIIEKYRKYQSNHRNMGVFYFENPRKIVIFVV